MQSPRYGPSVVEVVVLAAGILGLVTGVAAWIGGESLVAAHCAVGMGPQLCSASTTPLGMSIAAFGLVLVAVGTSLLIIWGVRRARRAPNPLP
ncbi:MAG TPA: hypothetical protein VEY07_08975 [Thermoplasmata archaeon]|nr:hypothetical protein [Thermoplasmata archaeon]